MWSLVKYPSGTNSPDKKSIFGNRGNLRIKGNYTLGTNQIQPR